MTVFQHFEVNDELHFYCFRAVKSLKETINNTTPKHVKYFYRVCLQKTMEMLFDSVDEERELN